MRKSGSFLVVEPHSVKRIVLRDSEHQITLVCCSQNWLDFSSDRHGWDLCLRLSGREDMWGSFSDGAALVVR